MAMELVRPSRTMTGRESARQTGIARFADDIQAAVLEFTGTVLFLTLAFGGVQAVSAEVGTPGAAPAPVVLQNLYISAVFGLSLLVSAWLFFRATGGLFNPNVSTALVLCGVITPVRFVLYCIAQLAGGIAAAGLVLALLPGPIASNTAPAAHVNAAQAVFIEAFITAALCLAVLMLGAEKHRSTPFAPVGVGLTLFACELFAVVYTGGAMNTARAFGPAVVSGFPSGKHWVYWVGPFAGSLFAAAFYSILKYFRYWRLSPGQDAVHEAASPDPAPTHEEMAEIAVNVGAAPTDGSTDGDVEAGRTSGPGFGEKGARRE